MLSFTVDKSRVAVTRCTYGDSPGVESLRLAFAKAGFAAEADEYRARMASFTGGRADVHFLVTASPGFPVNVYQMKRASLFQYVVGAEFPMKHPFRKP
jgi:hypothetical protein